MPSLTEIAAATCAGLTSTLLGHPLDTIKVHLQTHPRSLLNTAEAARSLLIQNDRNPLVFFRGIGPPLVNAVLMNTVMFSVFRAVKEGIAGADDDGGAGNGDNGSAVMVAGLTSGFFTAFLSTPVDYIKIQAQLGGVNGSTSASALLRQIVYLEKDPSRLFRGHVANLGREGVFTMVYLGLYDRLMSLDDGIGGGGGGGYNLMRVAAISSLTGGLAWIASYPFDTVKTIVQGGRSLSSSSSSSVESHITYRGVVRRLWSIDGIRTFYKGCATSTGRAVLVTSSRMIVYEFVRGLF